MTSSLYQPARSSCTFSRPGYLARLAGHLPLPARCPRPNRPSCPFTYCLVRGSYKKYQLFCKFRVCAIKTNGLAQMRRPGALFAPGLPTPNTPLLGSNLGLAARLERCLLELSSLFPLRGRKFDVHVRPVAENLAQEVLTAVLMEQQLSPVWGRIAVLMNKAEGRDGFVVAPDQDHGRVP
jgi:hypothetical protein